MDKPRILCVGHVTHDVYSNGYLPGGSAYYSARVYQALGAACELLAVVGEDFECDERMEDIPREWIRSGATTCFKNVYPEGAHRVQRIDAVAPPVPPSLLTPKPYELVHLAPVFGEVSLSAWLPAVRSYRVAISVQGWTRGAAPIPPSVPVEVTSDAPPGAQLVVQSPWTPTPEELNGVDVACVGVEDLVDQGDLLERLIAHVPIVTCTHGVLGSDLYVRGEHTRIGVFKTHEVDPTGAGDGFAGGFLYGLTSGLAPRAAAQLGAAAASIIVEEEGGHAIGRLANEAHQRVSSIPIGI